MTMQAPSRPIWTQCPAPMFIVGPAHAGKSELAIQALAPDRPAVVVGSAPTDEPAFRRRLDDLQTLRPGGWDSVYGGTDLVATVAAATERCQQVLIDSVSQWLAALLLSNDPEIEGSEQGRAKYLERQVSDLLSHMEKHPHVRFVVVSAEVGGGPAPSRSADRLFRQQVGLCNQRLAKAATTVIAVQSGIASISKR